MTALPAASRTLRSALPSGDYVSGVFLALSAFAFMAAMVIAHQPTGLRMMFALLILMNLTLLAWRWPTVGVITTIGYLLLMPVIRRLLIAPSGWSGVDPLLLVGPAIAMVLLARVLVLGRPSLIRDPLITAITCLLALMLLGVVNPLGLGLVPGLGGLLFMAVPLLWFLVGRLYGDRGTVAALLTLAFYFGVVSAIYGTTQATTGFPSWDSAWISATHFESLDVGGQIRPFGLSTSPTEYARLLLIALVVAIVRGLNGSSLYYLALPLLMTALWLSSVRQAIVLGVIMILSLVVVRARHAERARILAIAGIVAASVVFLLIAPQLDRLSTSDNALVSHQARGLAEPFNSDKSTLPIHFELFVTGVESGVTNPLGRGPGVTNIAATQFGGGESIGTDIDISNTFVSIGAVGGLVYVFVVISILVGVARRYRQARTTEYLAVFGILVSSILSWLIGEQYGTSALIWFLAGWATNPGGAGVPPGKT